MLKLTGRIGIPLCEIEIKAIRSQGPGGQNVNKVSTAIQLFFDIEKSSLPDEIKQRLLNLNDHRITESGLVVIKSQESRSQEANRDAALERLKQLILSVLLRPKRRKATKPSKNARERRLKVKSLRSRTKSLRNRPSSGD